MEARILEFGALLRHHGLRVSTAETLDALEALRGTGLETRDLVKDVLRTTLVKRSNDQATFDELFDAFFGGLGEAIREVGEAGGQAVADSPQELQDLLDRLQELLESQDRELSELAQALLQQDDGTLEKMIREAMEAARSEVGGQGRSREARMGLALGEALGTSGLARELGELSDDLDDMGLDPETAGKLKDLLRQRLADLAELLKRAARLENSLEEKKPGDPNRLGELGEKSFYYLSEEEIRRMNEAVTRLAQRLRNVVAIKRSRAKRGSFDLQRTLRHNIRFGGVPFDVRFDRRKKHKPQIVILCDVSDSVRNVSRFMLQFVYSLQDLYSKVRSFIFVADIGEVTRHFEDLEITDAVEQALRGDVINVFAHSDFGRAFKSFHREHLSIINRRTTVLILGDARNNYNLAHEWVIRDLQERAKQVLWLNPESKNTWGFGDSEMDRYAPFCDVVEECRNLNQLYGVIDRLVVG